MLFEKKWDACLCLFCGLFVRQVASDNQGNIYLTDTTNNVIWRVDVRATQPAKTKAKSPMKKRQRANFDFSDLLIEARFLIPE